MSDEREWEEQQEGNEWEEYERLWGRIIQLTKSFYESIAASRWKNTQALDEFLDSMILELKNAGYCPPPEDEWI